MTPLEPNDSRSSARRGEWFLFPAFDEAARLNHGWIGPEHVVLAILAPPAESVAARVLGDLGITHAAFSTRYVAHLASGEPGDSPTAENGTSTSPAWHELVGRADGLAAAFGATSVSAEHLLIAYLWDPDSGSEFEYLFDVKRETVIAALQTAGVTTPSVAMRPSPQPDPKGHQRVFVPADKVTRVAGMLANRLPRDSGLGFNFTDDDRAWIGAHTDIDLERYVAEALADLESESPR
jgi:ATP-dependent Clp protease ATP-binding subunit ClpA